MAKKRVLDNEKLFKRLSQILGIPIVELKPVKKKGPRKWPWADYEIKTHSIRLGKRYTNETLRHEERHGIQYLVGPVEKIQKSAFLQWVEPTAEKKLPWWARVMASIISMNKLVSRNRAFHKMVRRHGGIVLCWLGRTHHSTIMEYPTHYGCLNGKKKWSKKDTWNPVTGLPKRDCNTFEENCNLRRYGTA